MPQKFDHENLKVYQRSLDFVEFLEPLLAEVPKSCPAYDQINRASISIPLNIAEGNGKFTASDRCRFFDIARGSALECAAALDVLLRRKMIDHERLSTGKAYLLEIVSMLVGLIKSNSSDRVYEEQAAYGVSGD